MKLIHALFGSALLFIVLLASTVTKEYLLLEGEKALARDLILACIGEAQQGSDSCVMFYEAVEGRPITITIGENRLYCSQAGSEMSC